MKALAMFIDRGGEWMQIRPALRVEDPTGSLSSEPPEGEREVYVFGFMDDKPGVWRSKAGADIESGVMRALVSLGLEQLSDLSEPFEVPIFRPGIGIVRTRFELVDA